MRICVWLWLLSLGGARECNLNVSFTTSPPTQINPCSIADAPPDAQPIFKLYELGLSCPTLVSQDQPAVPVWGIQPVIISFNLPVVPFGMDTGVIRFGGLPVNASDSRPLMADCIVPVVVTGDKVPGMEGTWTSGSQFRLTPSPSWPSDSRFRISINPNIRSSSGQSLDGQSKIQTSLFVSPPLTPYISNVYYPTSNKFIRHNNLTELPPASRLEISFDGPIDIPTLQSNSFISIFSLSDSINFQQKYSLTPPSSCQSKDENCVCLELNLPPAQKFAILFRNASQVSPTSAPFGSSRDVFSSPYAVSVSNDNETYWDFGIRVTGLLPFSFDVSSEATFGSSSLELRVPHGLRNDSADPEVSIHEGPCPSSSAPLEIKFNRTSNEIFHILFVSPPAPDRLFCLSITNVTNVFDVYGQQLQPSSSTLKSVAPESQILIFPDIDQPFISLSPSTKNISIFSRTLSQIGDITFSLVPIGSKMSQSLSRSLSRDFSFPILPSTLTISPANFTGNLTIVESTLSLENLGSCLLLEKRTDQFRASSILCSPEATLIYAILPSITHIPIQFVAVPNSPSSTPVVGGTVRIFSVGNLDSTEIGNFVLDGNGSGVVDLTRSICDNPSPLVAVTSLLSGNVIITRLEGFCEFKPGGPDCSEANNKINFSDGRSACGREFASQLGSDRHLYAPSSNGTIFGFIDVCLSQNATRCVPTQMPPNTFVWSVLEFVDVIATPRGEFRRPTASSCVHTVGQLWSNGAFNAKFSTPATASSGPIAVTTFLVQDAFPNITVAEDICGVDEVQKILRSRWPTVLPVVVESPQMRSSNSRPPSIEFSASSVSQSPWTSPVSIDFRLTTFTGITLGNSSVTAQLSIPLGLEFINFVVDNKIKLPNVQNGLAVFNASGATNDSGFVQIYYDVPTLMNSIGVPFNLSKPNDDVSYASLTAWTSGVIGDRVQLPTPLQIVLSNSPYVIDLGAISPFGFIPGRQLSVKPRLMLVNYTDEAPAPSEGFVYLFHGTFNRTRTCDSQLPTLPNDQFDFDQFVAMPNVTKVCSSFAECILSLNTVEDYMVVAFARPSDHPTKVFACRLLESTNLITTLDLQLAGLKAVVNSATNEVTISFLNPFVGIAVQESTPAPRVVILWPVAGVSPSVATLGSWSSSISVTVSSTPVECIQQPCVLSVYVLLSSSPDPRAFANLVRPSVLLQERSPLVAVGRVTVEVIRPQLQPLSLSLVVSPSGPTLPGSQVTVTASVSLPPPSCSAGLTGEVIFVVIDRSWLENDFVSLGNSSDVFENGRRNSVEDLNRHFRYEGFTPIVISSVPIVEEILRRRVTRDVWISSKLSFPMSQNWDPSVTSFDLTDDEFWQKFSSSLTFDEALDESHNFFVPWVPECIPFESIRPPYAYSPFDRSAFKLPTPPSLHLGPALVFVGTSSFDGQVTTSVSFSLPNTTGNFVVSTFGVVTCESQFRSWATQSVSIITSKPLTLVGQLPDVLRFGDLVTVHPSVLRAEGQPTSTAEIRLKGSHNLSLQNDSSAMQSVTLDGDLTSASFIFRPQGLGSAHATFELVPTGAIAVDEITVFSEVVSATVPIELSNTFVMSPSISRNSDTTPAPDGFLKKETPLNVTIVERVVVPDQTVPNSNLTISVALGFADTIRRMSTIFGKFQRPIESSWDMTKINGLPDYAKPRPNVDVLLGLISAHNTLNATYGLDDRFIELLGQQSTNLLPFYFASDYDRSLARDIPLGIHTQPTWASDFNVTQLLVDVESQKINSRDVMDVPTTLMAVNVLDLLVCRLNNTQPSQVLKECNLKLKSDIRLWIKLLMDEYVNKNNSTLTYADLIGTNNLVDFYRMFTSTLRGNLPPQLLEVFSVNSLFQSNETQSCMNGVELRFTSLKLAASPSKDGYLPKLRDTCGALARSMQRSGAGVGYISTSTSNINPAPMTTQALVLETFARTKGARSKSEGAALATYIGGSGAGLSGVDFFLSLEALRALDESYGNILPNIDPALLRQPNATSTTQVPGSRKFPPMSFEAWQWSNAVGMSQSMVNVWIETNKILSVSLNSTFRGPVATTVPLEAYPTGTQVPLTFQLDGPGTIVATVALETESLSPVSQGVTIIKRMLVWNPTSDVCEGVPITGVPVGQTVCVQLVVTAIDAISSVVVLDELPSGMSPVTIESQPVPYYFRRPPLSQCAYPIIEGSAVWWSCPSLQAGVSQFDYKAFAQTEGLFVLPAARIYSTDNSAVTGSTGAQNLFSVFDRWCHV